MLVVDCVAPQVKIVSLRVARLHSDLTLHPQHSLEGLVSFAMNIEIDFGLDGPCFDLDVVDIVFDYRIICTVTLAFPQLHDNLSLFEITPVAFQEPTSPSLNILCISTYERIML